MDGDPAETEQSPSAGFGQERAGMRWLAWGRAGAASAAPQCRQQLHGQDPCQSRAEGHVPKPGLLVLPTGLARVRCQAVPEGFARLWNPQEEPPTRLLG